MNCSTGVLGARRSRGGRIERNAAPGVGSGPPEGRERIGGGVRVAAVFGVLLIGGCDRTKPEAAPSVAKPPTVRLTKAEPRDITRVVGQPSFVVSYERTAVYPKMTAYIEKWNVDIGDHVKKDEVMATLFVPELVEEYGTKKADVELAKQRIELAKKMVDVAKADVQAARARVVETEQDLAKYQAEVDRWDSEVKRLQREVNRGVVDPQVLLESTNQFKSSGASRDAAKATIEKAKAELLSRQAAAEAAEVEVSVAGAELEVADSESRRLKALVGYLVLPAPYDGIIVARNANTGDFVLPATGDPTALQRAPDISTAGAAPIYVVDRTDVVRVFVDVPEADANYVKIGTKATVLAKAFRDEEIPASVTRTSWALNVVSRTLRAEVDLPNPGSELLPGMYAYAKILIERPGVRALPKTALTVSGDKTFCMLHRDGKAVRTQVETGIGDGEWVEVNRHRDTEAKGADGSDGWVVFDGSEEVIVGDLSVLVDGSPVNVETSTKAEEGQRVAGGAPSPTGGK